MISTPVMHSAPAVPSARHSLGDAEGRPPLPLTKPRAPRAPKPPTLGTAKVLTGLAMLGAAVFGAIAPAAPALAHDELIDQEMVLDPADGALEAVQLTFNNTVMDVGTEIHVTGPDEADATDGDPEHDGPVVRQPLAAELTEGDYEVAWRVVSSDGHPIDGMFVIALTVDENGSAEGSTIVEPDDRPDEAQGEGPSGEATAAEDENIDLSGSEAGLPVWAIVLISIGGVAALIAIFAAVARKRRAPWENEAPAQDDEQGSEKNPEG